jgi:hypothetical protein
MYKTAYMSHAIPALQIAAAAPIFIFPARDPRFPQ